MRPALAGSWVLMSARSSAPSNITAIEDVRVMIAPIEGDTSGTRQQGIAGT
jgi:hypothetical protein